MAHLCRRTWMRLTEPGRQIRAEQRLFSEQALLKMAAPLFAEQLLAILVGTADTLMVSYVSEAAVSGVGLVNMFNTIFLFLFMALASGGAIVMSQYIGSRDKKNGNLAAGQLYLLSAILALGSMVLVLVFHKDILAFLFGQISPGVMDASVNYLRILALSYPALAIYSAGAAVYRSMGNTKTTMLLSAAMNALNILGNAVGIFMLRAGVAGIAWSSTIARVSAAIVMTALCFGRRNAIAISWLVIAKWNSTMMKRLLRVAVPNGIDNGALQLTKVALSSITALFGTHQIAANGVAQGLWELSAVVGLAMGPAFITVIGRCAGAGEKQAADYYMRRLLRITVLVSFVWNILILAATPLILHFYQLPQETKHLVWVLVAVHNVFCPVSFSLSSPFAQGLRAAGDIKFTMAVSALSTVALRTLLSAILCIWCNLGVVGIVWAMVLDWSIKAAVFVARYRSGKWAGHDILS